MKKYKIGEVLSISSISIIPQTGTTYQLYSLPSFDDGKVPEVVRGEMIQSNKYVVPNRCILFNKLNVRFKRIWRINNNKPNKLCSTEFLPLAIDESIIDYQYCYYLLVSDYLTNYLCGINSNTSGSHKRINPDILLSVDVALPPLNEQKRIGSILANFDRKIALNRAINHNLEAMAKQLYDYWFVQFDFPDENGKPYKSSGGKMVWNEKLRMEIPEGWCVDAIGNILDKYPTTKRYETKEYLSIGKYPIVDQGDAYIVGFTNENDNLLSRYPAVLFGDHSTKVKLLDFPFARGADGTQILYSKSPLVSQYYLYLVVASLQIPNPGYSRHFKYLKELPIVIPSKSVIDTFTAKVKPLYIEKKENIFANIALTKLRNSLLPLLMNGQVSLNYDLPHN